MKKLGKALGITGLSFVLVLSVASVRIYAEESGEMEMEESGESEDSEETEEAEPEDPEETEEAEPEDPEETEEAEPEDPEETEEAEPEDPEEIEETEKTDNPEKPEEKGEKEDLEETLGSEPGKAKEMAEIEADLQEEPEQGAGEDAAPAGVEARAGSLGISTDSPQAGQQNMYGYTGTEQTFTVRVSGYYSITAAGGKGGNGYISNSLADDHHFDSYRGSGDPGGVRTATYYIPAGTTLVVHVGNAGGSATGSDGGAAGWNDGQKGNFTHYKCDDVSNHNAKAATGGGGGSSYVKVNGTKLISGAGGGAGESAAIACEHTQRKAYAVSGGGSSNYVTSLGGITYREGASSGSNNGSGYVTVRIVKLLPSVVLSAAPGEWTNGEVVITAEAASEGEGIEGDFISWEKGEDGSDIWTDALTHAVSRNGTYTCKIRDKKGNEAQASIEIKNIDRISPEVEISPDTAEWTKEDVVLAAAGDDAQETGTDGKSGLREEAYLWGMEKDGGSVEWETGEEPDGPDGTGADADPGPREAWTKEDTRTAPQNGTYACRVRDRAGNITELSYKVKNIDRTAPAVSFTRPDGWYEGAVTVTWSGKDLQPDGSKGAGLHEEAYSFDGTNFGKECTQQIPGPGTYRIWVRDRLGNTAEYGIYIGYDEKPAPEDKETPGGGGGGGGNGGDGGREKPVLPVEEPDVPETKEGGDGGSIAMPVLPAEPPVERHETVVKLPEIAQSPVTLPEMPVLQKAVYKGGDPGENSGKRAEEKKKNFTMKSSALPYITGGVASAGCMFFFIIAFIVPTARIYELQDEKYRRKGWKFILPGKRKVDLRGFFENTDQNSLVVKLGWLYVKRNHNKEMTYVKPYGTEQKEIRLETVVDRYGLSPAEQV